MSKLVTLIIDGKEVRVPEGLGLVEAAAEADIEIPVFCHHHKLDPVGVCRMCLVEVEGQRKPVTACTMYAQDGMIVKTETPLIEHLRKGVLEFLLLNHPLDCPICDKGGECPLQDHTFKYGPTVTRLTVPKMTKRKAVDMGNFIVLDEERCILCRRCVRFDEEIALEGNLVVGQRAHEAMITTTHGQPYDSYYSGNTIELCPVGALTSKNYRFQSRPWDLSRKESICTACPVGCGTELNFRFGELLRIQSSEHTDVDGGWLCDRGRFNYRYIHGEKRITQPLMRRGDEFIPVGWTEALMEMANRLRTIQRDHGAEAIGFIGGGRLTNEEAYVWQKLARDVVGTPNIDHRVSEQQVTSWDAYDGRITDIDEADVIVNVDVVPKERMPVVDLRLRRAVDRRGATLYNIGAAVPDYERVSSTNVAVEPGQTAAALRRVAAFVAGEAEAAADEASSATDAGLQKLAGALREAKQVVFAWGGDDVAEGAALARLVEAVSARNEQGTVRVLVPGEQANSRGAEAMGVLPHMLPGHEPVAEDARGMNTGDMLSAAAAGELHGLYLVSANLTTTYPDGHLVEEALSKVPFLVVQDLFLTETARHADIVLPAAEFPAKTGTYTNLEGRIQEVSQAMAEGGSSKVDADIFRALAEALGGQLPAGEPLADEMQQSVGKIVTDGFMAGAPLPDVDTADADDAGAVPVASPGGEPGEGLRLVPLDRLFGGGGTAYFDSGFRHVQPEAEAIMHPDDAAALRLETGTEVQLVGANATLSAHVRLSPLVVPGTVQMPRGVPGASVTMLQSDGVYPVVRVRAQVPEEVV